MHEDHKGINRRADLDDVLADFMRRVDRGERIDQDDLIATNPELAGELRKFFSHAAALNRINTTATADVGRQVTPRSGALEVRCPNCHEPTEVAVDTTLTDLTCSSCGSHFSLVDQGQATRLAPSLSKLGRFELIERIGVGGFGSVWKARDKELDRTVAIKIPRAGAITTEEQEKFFREARAAAQLRHPNIVSVHEVGRDGDSIFIVSDLVRGVTLGDWLTGQKLTSREAAELCAKIADALHHAHEQGVVHRDLKPANIMIDSDRQPHLMDFGLARREAGEVTVTVDGQVLGTPAYMSPEQASGEGHKANRRSDVYSLGVIFFQLLTGEIPFRGNARMIMHQVIHDEPPSPRKLNASVPKDLETITLKCLEKDPERRYPTCKELSEELQRFLSGMTIQARPVGRPEQTIRWVRRNRTTSALLAVVAITLLVGTLVSSYLAIAARRHSKIALARQSEAIVARRHAETAQQSAEKAKSEAEQHLYGQLIIRAGQEIESNNVREARRLLSIAPTSLRGWEYGFLQKCSDRSISTHATLPSTDDTLSAAAVSPDAKTLLLGQYSGRVYLVDTENGDQIASHLLEGQIEALAMNPSHSLLAVSHSTYSEPPKFTVSIIDLTKGKLAAQLRGQREQVNSLTFSSDGKWLASGAGGAVGEHAVKIWSTDTWNANHVLRGHGAPVTSVAFNQKNTLVISGGGDRAVIWDISSGKEVRHFLLHGANAESVAISQDDSHVIVGGGDAAIRVWKSEGTAEGKVLRGHSDGVLSVVPVGDNRLVSSSRDRTIRVWDLESETQVSVLRGHDSEPLAAYAAAQSKSIISVDHNGILKSWDIDSSPDVETIPGPDAGVSVVAAGTDSGWIVTGGEDEIVRVWDLSSGKNLAELVGHHREGYRSDITGLAVVGKEPSIISSSSDLTVRRWSGRTFKQEHVFRGHKQGIDGLAATIDGNYAASTGSYDKQLILWDLRDGREKSRIEADSWWAGAIAFNPDSSCIACGGSQKTIDIRDTTTGKLIRTLGPHGNWIRSLAYSPDGKLLAAADGTVTVWNISNSNKSWTADFAAFVSKVAFSPDGSRLLTVDKDSVRLWDSNTGSQVWVQVISGAKIKDACFTPDGRRLIVGCRGTPSILVFDAGAKWIANKTMAPDGQHRRNNTTSKELTVSPSSSSIGEAEKPLRLESDAAVEVKVLAADGSPVTGAACRLLVGGFRANDRGYPIKPSADRELSGTTDKHGIVVFRHKDLTTLSGHMLYVNKAGLSGANRSFDCPTVKNELSITLHAPIAVTLQYVYQPKPSVELAGEDVVRGILRLYPMENGSYRPPARAFFDLANNRRVGGSSALKSETPGIQIDQVGHDVFFGGSRGRFDHATDLGKVEFDKVQRVNVSKLVREREDTKILTGHVYIYESNIYSPDKRTDFTGREVRYAKFLVESLSPSGSPSQIELSPPKPAAGRPLTVSFRPGAADLDGAHAISLYWAAISGANKVLSPPESEFDPIRFPKGSIGTDGGDFQKGGMPCVVVPMTLTAQDSWSATIDLPSGSRSVALLMVDELGRTGADGIATYDVAEAKSPD